MSDWNKNQGPPPPDDDDDLNLDWLSDEYKKDTPGAGGERSGLTGELPWLSGSAAPLSADFVDEDDVQVDWGASGGGIQPTRRGESTGITGMLDWQNTDEPADVTGQASDADLMPWQAGDTPPDAVPVTVGDTGQLLNWMQSLDADAPAAPAADADSLFTFADDDLAGDALPATDEALPDWMAELDMPPLDESAAADADSLFTFADDDFGAAVPAAAASADEALPDWMAELDLPDVPAAAAEPADFDMDSLFDDGGFDLAAEEDAPAAVSEPADFDMDSLFDDGGFDLAEEDAPAAVSEPAEFDMEGLFDDGGFDLAAEEDAPAAVSEPADF
ncbi:MAG: hypothetical protein MUE40_18995, partial [Anaerolineae bacterium]|nr:hypothetical protein [Anaerolineae bacterium]